MDELIEADVVSATGALEEMAKRRTELRRSCEEAVVEWRWARQASDLQRPEPLYHLRASLPAPKLLEDAPRVPRDEQQYGYDAGGEIVVTREYMLQGSFREELRVRRDDTVPGYRWSETGEPMEVNVARFRRGEDPVLGDRVARGSPERAARLVDRALCVRRRSTAWPCTTSWSGRYSRRSRSASSAIARHGCEPSTTRRR